jgi:hypothetical protein
MQRPICSGGLLPPSPPAEQATARKAATIARIMVSALSSTVMLRDCQTGGENDRLDGGAYRGSRRRLRHSISAVGPKIPSTEAVKTARGRSFHQLTNVITSD